jgi:hypothetical protein
MSLGGELLACGMFGQHGFVAGRGPCKHEGLFWVLNIRLLCVAIFIVLDHESDWRKERCAGEPECSGMCICR